VHIMGTHINYSLCGNGEIYLKRLRFKLKDSLKFNIAEKPYNDRWILYGDCS